MVFIEGKPNEARFAEGKFERLPDLAAELVRLNVDVIVAQGGKSTEAARRATTTIPIVMAPASGDAVAVGWIATLARPGANITGLSDESIQLSSKRMELLKEALPKARSTAILWNEADYGMDAVLSRDRESRAYSACRGASSQRTRAGGFCCCFRNDDPPKA